MSDDPKPDPVEAPEGAPETPPAPAAKPPRRRGKPAEPEEPGEEPAGPVGEQPHFPRVKNPEAKLSMAIGETLALVQRALPYLRAAAARGEPGATKLVADAEAHSAAVSRSKTKRQAYNDR